LCINLSRSQNSIGEMRKIDRIEIIMRL
jgi:hypothetical protein